MPRLMNPTTEYTNPSTSRHDLVHVKVPSNVKKGHHDHAVLHSHLATELECVKAGDTHVHMEYDIRKKWWIDSNGWMRVTFNGFRGSSIIHCTHIRHFKADDEGDIWVEQERDWTLDHNAQKYGMIGGPDETFVKKKYEIRTLAGAGRPASTLRKVDAKSTPHPDDEQMIEAQEDDDEDEWMSKYNEEVISFRDESGSDSSYLPPASKSKPKGAVDFKEKQ